MYGSSILNTRGVKQILLILVFERLKITMLHLAVKVPHPAEFSWISWIYIDYWWHPPTNEEYSSHLTDCRTAQQKRAETISWNVYYYRDMVPNKTALCALLNRLTSSKIELTWLQVTLTLSRTKSIRRSSIACVSRLQSSLPYIRRRKWQTA